MSRTGIAAANRVRPLSENSTRPPAIGHHVPMVVVGRMGDGQGVSSSHRLPSFRQKHLSGQLFGEFGKKVSFAGSLLVPTKLPLEVEE